MNTSVLIVCYLRPKNLDAILSLLNGANRKIYIFLDKAPSNLGHITESIKEVISSHKNLEIAVIEARDNCGVGKAVPIAIDQVLQLENKVIVLEDDCIPNEFALEYFDYFSKYLEEKVVMVSGRSSRKSNADVYTNSRVTYCSYPLINGWLVGQEGWNRINPLQSKFCFTKCLFWLIRHPERILVFCFFWAAVIRVRSGQLRAWDSLIAFRMLVDGLLSINPDRTCVTVLGVDEVASNTKILKSTVSEVYLEADKLAPSHFLDKSHESRRNADQQIESGIYNVNFLNFLSPLWALLRISPR